MPELSAIVVTHHAGVLLDASLTALERATADIAAEIIVVDNASAGAAALIREQHPHARLERSDRNVGFAGGVQRGLAVAHGEWVALVNDDAEVEPDALALMLAAGRDRDDVGVVTGQVRFHARPTTINTAGLGLDRLGVAYDRLAGRPASDGGATEEVFGASGCVALYRRSMVDAIGGFDASFFAFLEDADVAWRAQMAGWRCLYVPAAVSYHHGSATAGEASRLKYFLVGRNRIRLIAKNATTGQLLRWGWAMALYDLAYVTFVAATDRSLAPLQGRLTGLREWRHYRRAGAPTRRPVRLEPPTGALGAWRQRAAYRRAGETDARS
jgi:GT2 family glycosyltransferase